MKRTKIRITEEVKERIIPFMLVFPSKKSYTEWRNDPHTSYRHHTRITAGPGDTFEIDCIVQTIDRTGMNLGKYGVREYGKVIQRVSSEGLHRFYYAWALPDIYYEIV